MGSVNRRRRVVLRFEILRLRSAFLAQPSAQFVPFIPNHCSLDSLPNIIENAKLKLGQQKCATN